jgi:hypothetical protein
MAVASRLPEVNVTLRSTTLATAVLVALATSAAAQIVVGYPGPPWSRGAYDLTASLRIQSKPREAEVYVDGYYAGRVDDFDGTFQRLRVEPGDHEIALYLSGHRLYTQKAYLQPGNTFTIKHDMEKLAAGEQEPLKPSAVARDAPGRGPERGRDGPRLPEPPIRPGRDAAPASTNATYGTVSIRVQPADVDIFIDGDTWPGPSGDERLQVQLSAGTHRVEARKTGYRGYLTEVTVRAGETMPLNVALAKEK